MKALSVMLSCIQGRLPELLASYGQDQSGLEQLVQVGFATLGLQTFLTAGPKEARAWTIHIGDTAPKAAGVIDWAPSLSAWLNQSPVAVASTAVPDVVAPSRRTGNSGLTPVILFAQKIPFNF